MKLKDYKGKIILSIDNTNLGYLNHADMLMVIHGVANRDLMPKDYAKKSILKCFEIAMNRVRLNLDSVYYLEKEEYITLKLGSKIQCKPIFFDIDKEWHIEENADESDYENYEFVIIELDEEYAVGYRMDYFGIGELEFVAFMNNDLIDF